MLRAHGHREKHHKTAHPDECPYVCQDCGRGFHYRGSLYGHREAEHSEVRFECGVCGKSFQVPDVKTCLLD